MKLFKFTTENGSEVELTAGDVTTKHKLPTDFNSEIYTEKTELEIEALKINGQGYNIQYAAFHATYADMENILIFDKTYNTQGVINIPKEIFEEIYAGEKKRTEDFILSLTKDIEKDKKQTKHLEDTGFCFKCNSYCYGDCQS